METGLEVRFRGHESEDDTGREDGAGQVHWGRSGLGVGTNMGPGGHSALGRWGGDPRVGVWKPGTGAIQHEGVSPCAQCWANFEVKVILVGWWMGGAKEKGSRDSRTPVQGVVPLVGFGGTGQ